MNIPPTGKKLRMAHLMEMAGAKIKIEDMIKPVSLEQALARQFDKPGKYGNRKTEYNGRVFDSKHEAKCAQELDLLRSAKDPKERVVDVQYQVRYPIKINGKKICDYIADFVVKRGDGRTEVMDAKGVLTDVYKLKKKLMLAVNGIEIVEW